MKTTNQAIQSNSTRNAAQVCLASCRKLIASLARTKNALLSEFRKTLAGHEQLVNLALNEAEALAWETGFPQLVFPTLATEKVQALAAWDARQRSMQRAHSIRAFAA